MGYTTDVTPEKLEQLLERSVSANLNSSGGLLAEGRFGQWAGLRFVYDPSRQAQVVDRQDDGTVEIVTPGDRVRTAFLTNGTQDPSDDTSLIAEGAVVASAPNVDLASNSFTIGQNGDDYPFNLHEASSPT